MTRPLTRREFWEIDLVADQRERLEATIEHGFAPDPDIAEHTFAGVAKQIVGDMSGATERELRKSIKPGDTIWQRHKYDEGRIGKVVPVRVAERKGGVVRLKKPDDPGIGDWFALQDLRIYHVERPE